MTITRILVVCSGNTCRSPMAAGILGRLAAEVGRKVELQTAGLSPQVGEPLAKNAVAAMKEIDIDISSDYPKSLTKELVEWCHIIVPVDQRYVDEVVERFPKASPKVQPLTRNIRDPYCGDLSQYRECRDLLREAIQELQPRILGVD